VWFFSWPTSYDTKEGMKESNSPRYEGEGEGVTEGGRFFSGHLEKEKGDWTTHPRWSDCTQVPPWLDSFIDFLNSPG